MRRFPSPTASGRPGNPAQGSMLTQLMGNRTPRYNRLLDKLNGGDVLFKVPSDFGVDEHNVMLGMDRASIAAGASKTFTVNAPRDVILRDLIIDEVSLAKGAAGAQDATVTAITVEGNSILLGGETSVTAYGSGCFPRAKYDLPVAGGTPIAVTIKNNSAAANVFCPTWLID